jgi:hypothetical protein
MTCLKLALLIFVLSASARAQFNKTLTSVAEVQRRVVQAPNDRSLYAHFLELELRVYESYRSPRSLHFEGTVRGDILKLKIVMEDMFSLQDTIRELEIPDRTQEQELIRRLKSAKVPPAHRRLAPLIDPWGTPYRFVIYQGTGWGPVYKIISAGTDKKFDSANLNLSDAEIRRQDEAKRSRELSDDIVFLDGHNFTRIFDYPADAEAFLYTRCDPADWEFPDRVRCF